MKTFKLGDYVWDPHHTHRGIGEVTSRKTSFHPLRPGDVIQYEIKFRRSPLDLFYYEGADIDRLLPESIQNINIERPER